MQFEGFIVTGITHLAVMVGACCGSSRVSEGHPELGWLHSSGWHCCIPSWKHSSLYSITSNLIPLITQVQWLNKSQWRPQQPSKGSQHLRLTGQSQCIGGNLVWKTRKTSQPTLDTAPYCSNSFVRQQRSLQKWNLVWKTRKTAQPTIHTAPYCSNSFVRLQRSIQKWLQWSAEITAISACATAHEDLTLFQGQRSRELDLMITYRK